MEDRIMDIGQLALKIGDQSGTATYEMSINPPIQGGCMIELESVNITRDAGGNVPNELKVRIAIEGGKMAQTFIADSSNANNQHPRGTLLLSFPNVTSSNQHYSKPWVVAYELPDGANKLTAEVSDWNNGSVVFTKLDLIFRVIKLTKGHLLNAISLSPWADSTEKIDSGRHN